MIRRSDRLGKQGALAVDGREVPALFEQRHLLSGHHAVVSAISAAAGRQP